MSIFSVPDKASTVKRAEEFCQRLVEHHVIAFCLLNDIDLLRASATEKPLSEPLRSAHKILAINREGESRHCKGINEHCKSARSIDLFSIRATRPINAVQCQRRRCLAKLLHWFSGPFYPLSQQHCLNRLNKLSLLDSSLVSMWLQIWPAQVSYRVITKTVV